MLIKFKRAVAFILLLVYAPAVGFASPSLIWCIAEGGHSAVEVVSYKGQHGGNFSRQNASLATVDQIRAEIAHPENCQDQPVVSLAVQSRKPAEQLVAPPRPLSDIAAVLSSAFELRQMALNARNKVHFTVTAGLNDFAQLLQIKTVILRN